MRRAQQGITLMGFIIVLIVLGMFAYFAMKLIPMYSEYSSISQALDAVIKEPGIDTASEIVIRDKISRHFEISYVYTIEPKDIKLKREQNGITMSADYEVRKPLFYNIYLVGHFFKQVSTVPGKKDVGLSGG
jgi:Tfp pilus assembly major pilin PilA